MLILSILVFITLLLISSVWLQKSHFSSFELKRRAKDGDDKAIKSLAAQNVLNDLLSLQKIFEALLLIILVLLLNSTFGFFIGVLLSVIIALEYRVFTRIKFIHNFAQDIYSKFEHKIVKTISRYPLIFNIFQGVSVQNEDTHIYSRFELQHVVNESINALTADEKKLIINSLDFSEKLVSEVMTPRSMISSIKKTEFLGPLTLDDLHKTGHSRLPVVNGDIDHIVGILHLRGLLALDIKKSTTVEKAMDSKVYYIRGDQTLQHALVAFLRTHHHLFVVVNEFRETVGLLSLEDVIEALLGRNIIDEFDTHDDLRIVALRNPRSNNYPEKRENV